MNFGIIFNVTDEVRSFTWLIVYAVLITCHVIVAFNEENQDADVRNNDVITFNNI